MFYYVYQITCKVNGKIYIGCHRTKNLNDGYMGSGRRLNYAKKKYGIENFEKEILSFHESASEMFAEETRIVDNTFLERNDVYNLQPGGGGGFSKWHEENAKAFHTAGALAAGKIRREKFKELLKDPEYKAAWIAKLSEANKGKQSFLGKKHSEETKQKMRKSKNVGEANSQFGTCWVVKQDLKPVKIKKEQLDEYLSNGYLRGRSNRV